MYACENIFILSEGFSSKGYIRWAGRKFNLVGRGRGGVRYNLIGMGGVINNSIWGGVTINLIGG